MNRKTDRATRRMVAEASQAESPPDAVRALGHVESPATGGLPTRFCPACYARNVWEAAHCEVCGAELDPQDDFATRLIWALAHPETGVAVSAAATIAARHLSGAIGALHRTLRSPEVYRAAAAAEALTAFMDEADAREAVAEARRHPSVVVRRAVEARLTARARTVDDRSPGDSPDEPG